MEQVLRTREEVLEEFAFKGISIRGWALRNNLSPAVVHGVLKGRLAGNIGAAHKAAVLLGIKRGTIPNA